ncbi:DJ-1 family glyoxalase III [Planctomycetota bacterium]
MNDQTKTALVPIADGTEEIEAVCIIDTLRRAGIRVTVASVMDLQITASRGVKLMADTTIDSCTTHIYDLIALPGGMPGAEYLAASKPLIALLKAQKKAERLIGAICAAPAIVLQPNGLLAGTVATCYPSFQDHLESTLCSQDGVVVTGQTITGQGPGWALPFSLTLVEKLCGVSTRKDVAQGMLCE